MSNRQIQIADNVRGLSLDDGLVAKGGDIVVVSSAQYSRLANLISGGSVVDLGATTDPITSGSDPRPSADEIAEAETSSISTEHGVGKMMHAFVPPGQFWMLATEVISGWDAPAFQTVDGVGSYVVAPFTGAPVPFSSTQANTWNQNTTGAAIMLNVMAAIVGSQGTNGHMYLITSVDGVTLVRQDFLALRTGAAGTA